MPCPRREWIDSYTPTTPYVAFATPPHDPSTNLMAVVAKMTTTSPDALTCRTLATSIVCTFIRSHNRAVLACARM